MPTDLGSALVKGALWSIGLRWGLRVLGLVSTLVIARLLTPADYGLIAMAALVMGLVETFLDADAASALLRSANAEPDFIDSAWTLKLLQSLVVATAIAISAPFAAAYFMEPRLAAILWAYCIVTVGNGLSSVGPLLARRNLEWLLEVKVAFAGRMASFVATLVLAFIYRSYWSLVIGGIIGMLVGLGAGYLMHTYRPKIRFTHTRGLFGYSQWMLLSGIGVFFARKLDGFVVGRVGSAADMGAYNVALEIGQMITIELGAPLNRALLPVLAHLHEDLSRMQRALMKTVAAINTVTLPAGIGLALVASDAVPVLLGPQWSAAIPLLTLFSLVGAVRFVTGPYYTLLLTLGRSRLLAGMSWLELAIFAVAVTLMWSDGFSMAPGSTVTGIAYARVVSAVVIALVWILLGARFGLTMSSLGRAIFRPLVASLLMAICLVWLPTQGLPHGLALCGKVVAGALTYTTTLSFLWMAAGKPEGLEKMALDRFKQTRSRMMILVFKQRMR